MLTKICILISAIAILMVVGHFDYLDELNDEEEYCAMVKTWIATEGKAGWPAYRDDVVCH